MVTTRDGARTLPWRPRRKARPEQRRAEAAIALRAPLRGKGPRPQCGSIRNRQDSRAAVTAAGTGEKRQKEGGAPAACEPYPSPSGQRSKQKKSKGAAGAGRRSKQKKNRGVAGAGRRNKKKKSKGVAGAKQEQVQVQAAGSSAQGDSAGTAIQ